MHRPRFSVSTRRSTYALVGAILFSSWAFSSGCSLGSPIFHERPAETSPAISPIDLETYVRALTDPRMEGRRAGTPGEDLASDYLVHAMRRIGLGPAGTNGGYLHSFDFTAGISLGPLNELVVRTPPNPRVDHAHAVTRALEVGVDWRPLAFSASGEIPLRQIVFAGYGLVAPAQGGAEALNAYVNLDIVDRWVIVFRGLPHSLDRERRQELQRHASLRYKAMVARDLGARGILFVSGPLGRFRNELVPLRFDASLAGTRIAVVSISDALAGRLLSETKNSLEEIQRNAEQRVILAAPPHATRPPAFEIEDAKIAGRIDLETLRSKGHNVLGRLQVGAEPSREIVVLGAHFDHLGRGEGTGSLATGQNVGKIHPGADDNASGVAVLLEIAEQLVHRRDSGLPLGTRDFVFAAWSGEELGLLGSAAWVADYVDRPTQGDDQGDDVVAYLNFDMVGRLHDDLVVQGLGSSPQWAELLADAAAPLELSISPQQDSYLPTDTTSFYTEGIPVLTVFTGVHSQYHTPLDTVDRLNFAGAARIGELMSRIAQALSRAADRPRYIALKMPSTGQGRSGFRVFLGTVPDYAQTDVTGVRLTGVVPAGPAETSGIRGGDIIIEVDGTPIENLYDYTYALEALRVGESAKIVVLRDGNRISLEVVPTSRD